MNPSSPALASTDLPDAAAAVAAAIDVTDDAALAALCERARAAGVVIMDTEFERTDTFYPRIALIQMAIDGQVWLVDPLAITDTAPLRALLEDAAVEKVMHSLSEDMEVLNYWSGARPVAMFDTQLAAAFLGGRFGMGYGELVKSEFGIELDKGETRSNWFNRPLTASQHHYACLDVVYLGAVHARQRLRLEATGRIDWLLEEGRSNVADVLDRPGAEHAWKGVKGAANLSGRPLAALQRLAAWRDQQARDLDRPRSRVARDEHLTELARALPAAVDDLRGGVLPHGMVKRWGPELQEMVDAARALPEDALPEALPPPLSRSEGEMLKTLRQAARDCAAELGLAEELLARKRLIEQWLLDAEPVPSAFRGWRWPLVGDRLAALRDRRPIGAGR
ncbi:MAG TPA: ribonuclease D [Pseudomonadales bacterium]|nr:ribonuclease D [Pseudomonadales bacterium]